MKEHDIIVSQHAAVGLIRARLVIKAINQWRSQNVIFEGAGLFQRDEEGGGVKQVLLLTLHFIISLKTNYFVTLHIYVIKIIASIARDKTSTVYNRCAKNYNSCNIKATNCVMMRL